MLEKTRQDSAEAWRESSSTIPIPSFGRCSPSYAIFWIVAILVTLVLATANLFLGELNQDEGWYLYAARLVSQGQKPYVDFASTQGPVMPYVYAVAQPLADRWGVAGGRLFTICIGLLCSLGAAFLAARMAAPAKRKATAWVAFALAAVNVYQSYFFTIVKTYALTALFLALGFLALAFVEKKRSWAMAFLSGVLLSLAAGTRLSAVVVLPVVFLGLLWMACGCRAEEEGPRPGMGGAIGFAAGAGATLAVVFLSFWIRAPEGLRFALFDYHAGREAGGLIPFLAYKAGFVSRVVQDYFVSVGILLVVCAVGLFRCRKSSPPTGERNEECRDRKEADDRNRSLVLWVVWISVLAVTALHFSTPFPYDDYQVMIYPLFAAAVSVGLMRAASRVDENRVMMAVLLLCVAAAFSSQVNQSWFIGQRDRIWWPMKKRFPLAVLREAGQHIQSLTKSDDLLLTQDAYLAVESRRMVPHGMELGPFCYFPEWSREKASVRHVLNREMMMELLETCEAPVAAFSGYGLSIQSPQICQLPKEEQQALVALVEKRYQKEREIPAFGHAETTLKIYRRKQGL